MLSSVKCGYATLSDDDSKLVAVDGLLHIVVLGLEIFGEVEADSLLSDELNGNFLLESYTTSHLQQCLTNLVTHSR